MLRIRFSASRHLVPCTLYLKRAIRLCPSWREVHTHYANASSVLKWRTAVRLQCAIRYAIHTNWDYSKHVS